MNKGFYEDTLLREEFKLVAKLQENTEFKKYVTVSYEDRTTGAIRPISQSPVSVRYPEKYIVNYRMPVYQSRGQLRQDWHGTAIIELAELVLMNKHANQSPHTTFTSNFKPFNNHVLQAAICTGNAWAVAKDNGLWHFVISLGALINQDEFVCAEGKHFDEAAYNYWVSRGRKPVTNIAWPLNLANDATVVDVREKPQTPSTMTIVSRTTPGPAQMPATKASTPASVIPKNATPLSITPKETPKPPAITITERKK